MLLDSDVIIYAAQGKLMDHDFPRVGAITCSIISTIETLGYHKLPINELLALERFFTKIVILPLNDAIVEQAIQLRQARNMRLGDSIIAATALVHDLELWTNNTKDFKHIEELRLVNPLDLIK
jgi:predicted nucleic acid-binding protein